MLIEPVDGGRALLPGYLRLARRIVYEQGGARPEILWFDLPEPLAHSITQQDDGWLVALLPLALRRHEPLRCSAPVDADLLANVERLSSIWQSWYPEHAPVRVDATPAQPGERAERVGLFFTGGVDSFFSALHWDAHHPVPDQVRDLIYVWGYDIPLSNRAAFERKRATLDRVAGQLGKQAICLASNLRETRLSGLNWPKVMHGAALAAAALMLGGRDGTILLSAALARNADESFGAHPLTDHLMSTSRTRFIHYGDKVSRFDKTAYLAGSAAAQQSLHVCWEDASDRNCGRCEKCFRTQLTLELLGARDAFSCFDRGAFALGQAAGFRLATAATVRLMEDLRQPALDRQRPDVLAAIDRCLEANRRLNERLANSRWLRRAEKWKNSIGKRYLRGRASLPYWLVTVGLVALLALQFSNCSLRPEKTARAPDPVASRR